MMPLNNRSLALLVILFLAVLPAACIPQDRALVRVDGQAITERQLQQQLLQQDGARLLLEMIDTRLVLQAAAQKSLTPTPSQLAFKLNEVVARCGSQKDFEAKLMQRHLTHEAFNRLLRADVLLDRLAEARLQFSEQDLKNYYNSHLKQFSHGPQVRARFMLFTNRQNAETVLGALKQPGADFAGLARAFSQDPATKDKGGDTGFFERADYAKPISDAAFALQPGQMSGLLKVPDGFAILKVLAKRPAGPQPFAEVRDSIASRMRLENLDGARADWLAENRRAAHLVIPNPVLERGVRALIQAGAPYDPTNLTNLPMAPR